MASGASESVRGSCLLDPVIAVRIKLLQIGALFWFLLLRGHYVTASLSAKVESATASDLVTVMGGRKSSVKRFLVTLPNSIKTFSAARACEASSGGQGG